MEGGKRQVSRKVGDKSCGRRKEGESQVKTPIEMRIKGTAA